MALSKALGVFQELVADLEQKEENSKARITSLEAQNQLLINLLVQARNENQDLVNRCLKTEKKLERCQPGSQEIEGGGQNALVVFPEEVWEMIFESISDPQDLKSLYETCQEFRPLLEDQRTIFLFQEVAKVLVANAPGFGSNQLLKCRQVCRGWKQGVDHFLEQESPSFGPILETGFLVPSFHFKFSSYLGSLSGLQYPHPHYPSSGPGPNRSVVYNENFPEGTQSNSKTHFRRDFTQKLEAFGLDIWSFKMIFARKDVDWESAYGYPTQLRYLELMPNLKELHLCKPLFDSRSDNKSYLLYKNRMEQLERIIVENPFPNLPAVKRIILEDCIPALIESVLKANPQVEQLKILGQEELELCHLKLPNLHEICLINLPNKYVYLGNDYWPVTKLTLDAPNVRDWESLFNQFAEKIFKDTLTELDLRLCAPCDSPEDLLLELPNLTSLKLRLSGYFHSIDFILPLVSLEYLEVDFINMSVTDSEDEFKPLKEIVEIVKMQGYVKKLKKSNVWQLLPKLKQVKARTDWNKKREGKYRVRNPKWYCCTRDEVKIKIEK